jgi:hypothetical protein
MGTDRFDQRPVLHGHWKALGHRRGSRTLLPDRLARVILLTVPVVIFCLSIVFSWTVRDPSSLLSGVSLLAGSLVGVFALLAAWRERLTERRRKFSEIRGADCAAVDEAVAHILVAILVCVVLAGVLVVGSSGQTSIKLLTSLWAGVVYGMATYLMLVFLMIVPALYSAYVRANSVEDDLNGFVYGFNNDERSAS